MSAKKKTEKLGKKAAKTTAAKIVKFTKLAKLSKHPKASKRPVATAHVHPHEHRHAHRHTHGGSEHEHVHGHEHAHEHEHDEPHAHPHDHSHEHGDHAHAHELGADHDHAHGHEDAHGHAHGHGHSHDHGHVHGHAADEHTHDHLHGHGDDGHGHSHEHADRATRSDLGPGEGRGKILFFDAPSGLAGDMIIAALVDLGVPEHVVTDAVERLPLKGFHVHFGSRVRSGIVATSFDVHVDGKQPERTYGSIRKMLDEADLPSGVRARAQATFLRLAESEAKVHRMPLADVHFHEVGAIDAIVDVVGSAAALEYLGARVVVSPLPMGHGWVKARHGVLPLPAPAVVECLRGLPTYDGGIAFELVTPTGAAIVGAHAEGAARWPAMKPERAGWGAGTAQLADRPNLLRVVLGESAASSAVNTHAVIEANIDDATGELLGSCIEALFAAGALDAWVVPHFSSAPSPLLPWATPSPPSCSVRAPPSASGAMKFPASSGLAISSR